MLFQIRAVIPLGRPGGGGRARRAVWEGGLILLMMTVEEKRVDAGVGDDMLTDPIHSD